MKKLKFILPVVAFVMAVGLSFAFNTENYQTEPEAVNVGGTLYGVDANCPGGAFNCTIRLTDDSGNPISGELQVFGYNPSTGNHDIVLMDSSPEPILIRESDLREIE